MADHEASRHEPPRHIVGLGEILWDVFPDGPRFGGAPANVASSAAELAAGTARVTMVGAVGADDLGHRARAALAAHGVDTSGVQEVGRPTGQVFVSLDAAGHATYRFADDPAWDHLAWNDSLARLAAGCDAVCFGTLCQRAVESRTTIRRFVEAVPAAAIRVLDVNLRPPFDDDGVILASLEMAHVVKLNDEELPRVAMLCGLAGDPATVVRRLAERYRLRAVALTRGPRGALLLIGDELSDLPGREVTVVDTVGAGDAYTAAVILGLLAGQDAGTINARASAVAGHACTVAGGTMTFPVGLRMPLAG
jgi:fructokinase